MNLPNKPNISPRDAQPSPSPKRIHVSSDEEGQAVASNSISQLEHSLLSDPNVPEYVITRMLSPVAGNIPNVDRQTPEKLSEKAEEPNKKPDASWREALDPLFVEHLDERLTVDRGNQELIEESCKWRENDIKGNRRTFYIKEVSKKNDLIMSVTETSPFEQLALKPDPYPCLPCFNFRQQVRRVRLYITLGAETIIKHPAFETISITVILLNCVTLAMEDPTAAEVSQVSIVTEWAFQILYTVEMCLKIIGLGFLFGAKEPYLRDPWNVLDFVIVMSAWLTII